MSSLFSGLTSAVSGARETVAGISSTIETAKSFGTGTPRSLITGNNAENKSGDGRITQSERLFTVRPRSTPPTNASAYTDYRGPVASIKLITNKDPDRVLELASLSSSASSTTMDSIVQKLMSDDGYSDFFVTGIQTAMDEKVQINEVFGDAEVVYYFGKSPVVFNINGILFDDVDNNWFYNFIIAYSTLLRGSRLAKDYQLVQLNLPNVTLKGTISSLRYSQDSARDTDINFQFSLIVKEMIPTPVTIPTELLSHQAMKLNINTAGSWARFQTTAEINGIKERINSMKASLSPTMDGGSGWGSSAMSTIEGWGNSVNSTLSGWSDSVSGLYDSARSMFEDATGGLFSVADLRANVLSPVYGVFTTLTKVVKSITGNISSILNAAANPLKGILKDIRTISNEALALVNAIEDGISDVVKIGTSTADDIRKTIRSLKNTAGAISRTPEDVTNILKRLSKAGKKSGNLASLKSNSRRRAKAALLNSGTAYTPSAGAIIDQ